MTVQLCSALIFAASLVDSAAWHAAPVAPAEPDPRATSGRPRVREGDLLKNILRDQGAIWSSPFRLHARDVRWLAPFGLGTAGLIATDRSTAGWVGNGRDLRRASRIVSRAGASYTTLTAAGAFYLVGRLTHDERARETGLLGFEALVDATLVTGAVKLATNRERPLEGEGHGDFWRGSKGAWKPSFPSGHASAAWALAAVVAREYGDHRLVAAGVYALASLVSVSRFTGRRHFASDVLVGSGVGYLIGRYVYRTRSARRDPADPRSPSVPAVSLLCDPQGRRYAVVLTWRF